MAKFLVEEQRLGVEAEIQETIREQNPMSAVGTMILNAAYIRQTMCKLLNRPGQGAERLFSGGV